ncbi:STAS domain-containing protein [Piscibacillus halophilus]|uniref:Anti-sigma factor antagonist n=1 Tax=Piscibacillus halophilus TaxID=571933 RepID=A0A1H9MI41_9BACI|nr:STAS domain-containing protein [Piscibacillus halophilus]SER23199.1 anti-sigma B factor antagonist [Piscibacillus halophilus]
MNLHIEDYKQNQTTVIKLSGEIDAYTAPELKDKLLGYLNEEGAEVHVDLEKVNYMDSTGLGVFISGLKTANEVNSSFKLINLQENVYRLFNITGLNDVMNIENTVRGDIK